MIKPPVIVVANESDIHAKALCATLLSDFGLTAHILDIARFPKMMGDYRQATCLRSLSMGSVVLDDVQSVWWRRPAHCDVPKSLDPSQDDFSQAECDGFVQGLLWSLDAVVINDPGAQHTASRKIVQLTAAQAVGLAVPDTLITNDPSIAVRFVADRPDRTIFKRTGTSPGQFTETRLVTTDHLSGIDGIRYAPTTFQEYIAAECDIRVVWIGGEAWAVRIDSQAGAGCVDSRLDNTVAFTPFDLPAAVSKALDALMQKLGLVFGVIDMRVSADDGQIYFLEVNPQGQFAYLEIKTGLPIFRSLAGLLAEPVRYQLHAASS